MPAVPAAAASPSPSETGKLTNPIYLDNLATTPLDPRVLEAMLPYLRERFGNPSSRSHAFGWAAAEAVERAREQVAGLIGAASPDEIVFTSGATEANGLALKGAVAGAGEAGLGLVTCATEHPAVLDCCRDLAGRGYRLQIVPVDGHGRIDLEALAAALGDPRVPSHPHLLLSVMAANNEIGALQPLGAVGELAASRGALWHCDAAQAVGKVPLDVQSLGVDLLSISGHKIYGPKGVGALYIRRRRPRIRIAPQVVGGGQERGLRSGTLNVPGIVGLGAACQLCAAEMAAESERVSGLRDRLWASLEERLPGLALNGHPVERLPGCLNVRLGRVDGSRVLAALRDVALSSGSACASASSQPSPVLRAIGCSDEEAFSSVRFGIGRFNTAEEIDRAAARVADEAQQHMLS
ncbi:MAG: cysteine desulfurase family protein [Gemmatimonadota bacterium]